MSKPNIVWREGRMGVGERRAWVNGRCPTCGRITSTTPTGNAFYVVLEVVTPTGLYIEWPGIWKDLDRAIAKAKGA